jgi:tellurite resistance protein
MIRHCKWLLSALLALSGCSAPTATLDLIGVARRGIAQARRSEQDLHAAQLQRIDARINALDAAFDADVRLAAAGAIRDDEGDPVKLTAEWVIEARKGYAAARDMLAEQARQAAAAHVARDDNLLASDEALEMASRLTVQQWRIAEQIKQQLVSLQRRYTHEQ